jgi:NAD(P)-dependent dehydrogenase (short-subunit alcohol dehydrogenase family)
MAKTRTALITGGARRLGRAFAVSLAGAGWDIAIHYNASAKPASELAAAISSMGRRAYTVQADLADAKAVASIFPRLKAQGIVPDCLINNASVFEKDTLAALNSKRFHAHMDINLFAPLLLMRDFAAHYKGASGNIINITDGVKGWSMSPAFLSYALSKQGFAEATRMLARELAPAIRINAIAPGVTPAGSQDKKAPFARFKKIIPLARLSSAEEICDAIHYILSAPSLTGQILSLSGGMDST